MKSAGCLFFLIFFVLILGCQNSSSEYGSNAALSDTTSVSGLTGEAIKLVKKASLHFKVKDVTQSSKAVSALALQLGGMVSQQRIEYFETGQNEMQLSPDSIQVVTAITPTAGITVRVPADHLEAFMYMVADLGYFTKNSELQIDDESLQYLENKLMQLNRKGNVVPPVFQKSKPLNPLQTIAVNDEAIRLEMANRNINASANYSTISLYLFQNPMVTKEIIANSNVSTYHLPFTQRMRNAFTDGLSYFQYFIVVLTNFWVFIAVGCITFLVHKYLKQKSKLPLLKGINRF